MRQRGLELDLAAVMMSSATTGLLGFLFWAVAARGLPTSEVGRASAIVSTATMLATLANLSLGSLYERFLPVAGTRARGAVLRDLTGTSLLALLLGVGLLVVGPRERLFDSWASALWFPVCVAALAVFALLDPVLIGLRRPRQIAVKNVSQSVFKLVMLVAAVLVWPSGSLVVAAWVIPAVVIAVVVSVKVVAPALTVMTTRPQLPQHRELWQYFAGTYAMTVVGVLVPLLVPLVVIAQLGTEANAFFNMTWLLVSTIAILVGTSSAPYIAAAVVDPVRAPDLTTRFVRICFGAGLAGAAFLLLFGPLILRVFGAQYAEEGGTLVRLMALTLPFVALMTLYSAQARIHRKLRLAATVQWGTAVAIVAGITIATPWWGLDAVGIVYLSVEVAAALVIAIPLTRLLRTTYAAPSNVGPDS